MGYGLGLRRTRWDFSDKVDPGSELRLQIQNFFTFFQNYLVFTRPLSQEEVPGSGSDTPVGGS